MTERERLLIETRREEAFALFSAGRSTNDRADRVLGFGVSFITAAVAAGIANGFPEVMLAVPVALSFLFSYVLQLYADLIALGVARGQVEKALERELGGPALIYEDRVAAVRHGDVNPSIPFTQAMYALMISGSGVAGAIIAARHATLALVVYLGATGLAVTMMALSIRDMRAVWGKARAAVKDWPQDDARAGRRPAGGGDLHRASPVRR